MSGWIKVARRASDSRTTVAGGAVACVTWAGAAASCATRPSSASRRARGARCGGSLHLDRPCSTRRGGPSRPPLAQAFQDSQTGGRSQPATGAELLRNVWVDPVAVARWFAGAPPAASMPSDGLCGWARLPCWGAPPTGSWTRSCRHQGLSRQPRLARQRPAGAARARVWAWHRPGEYDARASASGGRAHAALERRFVGA